MLYNTQPSSTKRKVQKTILLSVKFAHTLSHLVYPASSYILALMNTANGLWPWIILWLQRCIMVDEDVLVFPVTTRWHTQFLQSNVRWQYQSILMLRKHLCVYACVCVCVCVCVLINSVSMEINFFRDVTPHCWLDVYQSSRGSPGTLVLLPPSWGWILWSEERGTALHHSSTLKREASRSTVMLVPTYKASRRPIPEESVCVNIFCPPWQLKYR
jgi:hypothetical protein